MPRLQIIISCSLFTITLFAANPANANPAIILNLLGANRIDELKGMQYSAEGVDKMFLDALFESDGASAAEMYRSIWGSYRQHLLAWEALARLREYHFAIGEYKTAAALAETLKKRPPESIPIEKPDNAYGDNIWVQTGAFSNVNNAQALKRKLTDMGYPVTIIRKQSGGRNLHIVRVGGFQSKERARQAAQEIEKSLGVKTRILVGSQ